ncbi:MAG TPA: DUF4124 domain-containing protein [Burkholderiales bacterium]
MKKLAVVALALALAVPAFAQQYKWIDQDGKVRYGDLPPAGVKATPLKPPSGPAAPASAPAAAQKKGEKALTPEQAFQKRQKDREEADQKAEKERAESGVKRANCDSAQAALRQLQSGARMNTMNAAGERIVMEDSQRASEMARAQKAVTEWCN